MKKPLVDERAAAAMLSAATQTMRNRRAKGLPPAYIKIGRSVRYDVEDLERFIEAHKVPARQEG